MGKIEVENVARFNMVMEKISQGHILYDPKGNDSGLVCPHCEKYMVSNLYAMGGGMFKRGWHCDECRDLWFKEDLDLIHDRFLGSL